MTQNVNPAVPPYKQLRRPVDDRMVAGVCSGIARYTNLDPTAVRALYALITVLTWGTALLAYPVLWFIMPEDRGAAPAPTGPTPAAYPRPVWPGANAPVSPPHPPAA